MSLGAIVILVVVGGFVLMALLRFAKLLLGLALILGLAAAVYFSHG